MIINCKNRLKPSVLWAQRNDCIYLTIEVVDVTNESIKLEPGSIEFSGTSQQQEYKFALDFFEEINTEVSSICN